MTLLDSLTARAQVGITLVFVLGYFMLLFTLILGYSKMQPGIAELVSTLVSVLTAVVVQICSYWFARHRSKETTHAEPQDSPHDIDPYLRNHRDWSHRVLKGAGFGTGRMAEESDGRRGTADTEVRAESQRVQTTGESRRDPQQQPDQPTSRAASGA